MASIKLPYFYREFKNSRLATFVDKHTHKPSSCFWISFFLTWLVYLPLIGIFVLVPEDNTTAKGIYAIVMLGFPFVFPVVFSFLLPHLSDRFDWAGKIARSKEKKAREQMMKELLEKAEPQKNESADQKD